MPGPRARAMASRPAVGSSTARERTIGAPRWNHDRAAAASVDAERCQDRGQGRWQAGRPWDRAQRESGPLERRGGTMTARPPRASTRSDARAEGKGDGKAAARPEGKSDIKAEGKPEAGGEGKADVRPEGRADARAEGRADARAEGRADARGEGK